MTRNKNKIGQFTDKEARTDQKQEKNVTQLTENGHTK